MEHVAKELVKLNEKVDVIIGIMKIPENKVLKVMAIIGNAVSIASALAIVEIIRNWILGG